jgi:hypothetical protein
MPSKNPPMPSPKTETSGDGKVSLLTVMIFHNETPKFSGHVGTTYAIGSPVVPAVASTPTPRQNALVQAHPACGRLRVIPDMELFTARALMMEGRCPDEHSGHLWVI